MIFRVDDREYLPRDEGDGRALWTLGVRQPEVSHPQPRPRRRLSARRQRNEGSAVRRPSRIPPFGRSAPTPRRSSWTGCASRRSRQERARRAAADPGRPARRDASSASRAHARPALRATPPARESAPSCVDLVRSPADRRPTSTRDRATTAPRRTRSAHWLPRSRAARSDTPSAGRSRDPPGSRSPPLVCRRTPAGRKQQLECVRERAVHFAPARCRQSRPHHRGDRRMRTSIHPVLLDHEMPLDERVAGHRCAQPRDPVHV